MSEESKQKISRANSGRKLSEEHKKKLLSVNIGRKQSEETKKKLSEINKGKQMNEETKRKISNKMKGRIISNETKQKMSNFQKGRKKSEEMKIKLSIANTGKKTGPLSEETKQKISNAKKGQNKGEKCHFWKGGISFEPYCPKWTKELKERIRTFFEYRCICCGKHENELKRKLCCHHVEYNKKACCDGKPVHFAAMCQTHHNKTNFDRERWEAMLHRIIDEIYDGKSYYTKEEYKKLTKM
jgi:hypothetical protein